MVLIANTDYQVVRVKEPTGLMRVMLLAFYAMQRAFSGHSSEVTLIGID
jgi:hypothetical protein